MKPQLENCIRKREKLKIMSNLISVLIYIAVGFLPGHLYAWSNALRTQKSEHRLPTCKIFIQSLMKNSEILYL